MTQLTSLASLRKQGCEYKIHVISKKNDQTAVNYRVDKN